MQNLRDHSESNIEKYLIGEVEKNGGKLYKFTSSVAGVPDRIMILKGIVWFIEVKKLTGIVSEIQKATIRKMMSCGAECFIVRSKSQALRIVKNALRCSQLSTKSD